MLERAIRAIILNRGMYREIGDDPQEMFYSLGIVLIAAAAFGFGLGYAVDANSYGVSSALLITMAASSKVTSWVIWAGFAYLIGRAFGGCAGFRRILRNLGFAFGIGALAIVAGIPWVGTYVYPLSFLWLYPAGLVAIKETHRIGWIPAVIANSVGWIVGIFLIPAFLLPPPS